MREKIGIPIMNNLTCCSCVCNHLYSSLITPNRTLVTDFSIQFLDQFIHYSLSLIFNLTWIIEGNMIVITNSFSVTYSHQVIKHTTISRSFLWMKNTLNKYKTTGITLVQIITDIWLSLHQHHFTRSDEKVDILVNSSELIEFIIRLSVSLIARWILTESMDDWMSSNLRITNNTNRNHVTSLLLDWMKKLEMSISISHLPSSRWMDHR